MHLATVVKGEGGRIRGHSGAAVGLGVIGHGCVRDVCCGEKVWWAWYVGLGTQGLWLSYALVTSQYGFLASVVGFGSVYARNAYLWSKERKQTRVAADSKVLDPT